MKSAAAIVPLNGCFAALKEPDSAQMHFPRKSQDQISGVK
jgi:hypothetical protein